MKKHLPYPKVGLVAIAGVNTGLVIGRFVVGLVDGADEDDEPDMIGARGTIEFTPSTGYVAVPTGVPNPFTMLKHTFVAVLDDQGYLCTPSPVDPSTPAKRGIRLFSTDTHEDPKLWWTWRVVPKFVNSYGAPTEGWIAPFEIPVYTNGTIDLTTFVR